MNSQILCSICVATYKRPELLKRLIQSLYDQNLENHVNMEIIIVDNDKMQSGKAVADSFEQSDRIKIIYDFENVKNISFARNKTVALASGEYILFIDDDEFACKEWVTILLQTLGEYCADAVFGRVIPEFHSETSDWIKKNPIFLRASPPTGTIAKNTRTGNCIIKAQLLKEIPGPFDPSYGISGGGDTHMFDKLRKTGVKFVNSYEGWVSEIIPPDRTTVSWLMKRALRGGNCYARRTLEGQGWVKNVQMFFKTILFAIVGVIFAIVTIPSKEWRFHWTLKATSNFGALLAVFGYVYEEYR